MTDIYLTHCSREKDDSLIGTGQTVTPDRLYRHPGLQAFIHDCQARQRRWAIFSDHYGVVFPDDTIAWYSKPPSTVSEEEADVLLDNFCSRLQSYETIYFRLRSTDRHPLFEKICQQARQRGLNVQMLTDPTN